MADDRAATADPAISGQPDGDLDAARESLARIEHHAGASGAEGTGNRVTFHRAANLTPAGQATLRAMTRGRSG